MSSRGRMDSPLKKGVGLGGGGYNSSLDIKSFTDALTEEVGSYQHTNVDLLVFAEAVWGLQPSVGKQILDMNLMLDSAASLSFAKARTEAELHSPYKALAKALLNDVLRQLGEPVIEEKGSQRIWDKGGLKAIEADGRVRKPDMLHTWTFVPHDRVPEWSNAKHILEMKLKKTKGEPLLKVALQGDTRINQTFDESKVRPRILDPAMLSGPSSAGAVPTSTMTGAKRPREDSTSEEQDSGTSSHASKRARNGLTEDGDSQSVDSDLQQHDEQSDPSSQPKARRDNRKISKNHIQVAGYAMECLAATSRHFVSALLVEQWKVIPCVFDRHLVACASSFRFNTNPGKMALVLYAMHKCDLLQAGYDPHLRNYPSDTDPKLITKDESIPLSNPLGGFFEFKKAALSPVQGDKSIPPITCFKIMGTIRKPDDLISRATTVYKVARRLSDGSFSEEPSALKFSWPLEKRVPENEIVDHLKKVLPARSLAHLPNIFFAITLTPEELNIPWTKMDLKLTKDNHQDRVFRGLASPFYKKLWQAGSIENFKKVWLDCLQFHYLAFRKGKVLHRDISEHNLMVHEHPDGTVAGILNDWDMAKFVDTAQDGVTAGHHRTGTPPFMALDLIHGRDRVHHLRHDLESFFYILIWAVFHYKLHPTNGTKAALPHEKVANWLGTPDQIYAAKNGLMMSMEYHEVLQSMMRERSEWVDVVKTWIEPLHKCIRDARSGALDDRTTAKLAQGTGRQGKKDDVQGVDKAKLGKVEEVAGYDDATYGGRLTYFKFMKAIGMTKTLETWDDAIDFKEDKAILRAEKKEKLRKLLETDASDTD
ncbi:hypothetical protein DFP72DRAFT_428272 [Ephemerocybe angulata]|uniref:Protein kinase domain-containing protein n=1 Tax=Ephemerocybe angulata TaxID=980116 RepID=A0A8H6HUV3_9AGAR|nr:hypothetical protein DFP72DRAFT_428272 [Tulosesus angulatus]